MLELRQNARGIIGPLRKGESFTLTYRNHPVGELRPILQREGIPEDDPVYGLADFAEDLGSALDAREADSLIYG